MDRNELSKALEQHDTWVKTEGREGIQANLSEANLSGADLSEANLRRADLSEADLRWADLSEANLSGANLSEADLSEANLSGADLRWVIGNSREINTIQAGVWSISYSTDNMAIGCQQHPIADWFGFSDGVIDDMDSKALEFWRKWKPILMVIMGVNP